MKFFWGGPDTYTKLPCEERSPNPIFFFLAQAIVHEGTYEFDALKELPPDGAAKCVEHKQNCVNFVKYFCPKKFYNNFQIISFQKIILSQMDWCIQFANLECTLFKLK